MLNLKIRYTTKQGELGASINGVKYTYFLDAGFIPKIIYLAKRRPGRALSFLKEVARSYIKEEFCVIVKAYEECWTHSTHGTREEAEDVRSTLEAQMPGAKIEVLPLEGRENNEHNKTFMAPSQTSKGTD